MFSTPLLGGKAHHLYSLGMRGTAPAAVGGVGDVEGGRGGGGVCRCTEWVLHSAMQWRRSSAAFQSSASQHKCCSRAYIVSPPSGSTHTSVGDSRARWWWWVRKGREGNRYYHHLAFRAGSALS